MSVSFAKKKDQATADSKDDSFDLFQMKRFLFECLTEQIIIGLVLNDNFLIVLAKNIG